MVAQQSHETSVVVLDDDIRFIRMVERVLSTEGLGVQPVTTLDLDEALGVIRASNCRMAMIDIFMYGSAAGFDMVRLLREDPATAALPLLITSGARKEIGKNVDFLQEHRCEVLLKPFEPDDLLSAVRGLLMPAVATGAPANITALSSWQGARAARGWLRR